MNEFACVTENAIKIYDKQGKIRLVYEGLNIRGCYDVHQGYLYTISSTIHKPVIIYRRSNDWEAEK